MPRSPVAIALVLLLTTGPALAQERPWPVLERMGVAGTWSPSCSAGPSKTNIVSTYYTEQEGLVRRRMDRGADGPPLNMTIDAAQQLSPTTFRIRQRQDHPNWGASNGIAYEMIGEISNGHMRFISSRRVGGEQLVKDGVVVATGKPVPISEKCGN